MRQPRNPFRLRTAEHIESDEVFLRLFGCGMLDVLPKDDPWGRVQTFQSAPGGGKTSLFRLFTAPCLRTLCELASVEEYRDLYLRMRKLGAVSDEGPNLLGVMLSCARDYSALEDIGLDPSQARRLLFTLLNSRIIIAALRGLAVLAGADLLTALKRIEVVPRATTDLPPWLPLRATGGELFGWARETEKQVFQVIDSFAPPSVPVEGHDTLHALSVIRPDTLLLDNRPAPQNTLVMLDDCHKFTETQRKAIFEALVLLRPTVGVWLAERLDALSPRELLGRDALVGREYGLPVVLEDHWRASRAKRDVFRETVTAIADKRIKSAPDARVGSFAECLRPALDRARWVQRFEEAARTVSDRVRAKTALSERFAGWLSSTDVFEGTAEERAMAWRALEIQIERAENKPQPLLDMRYPGDAAPQPDSQIAAAAEFYLAEEFRLPYYYGLQKIADLASSNIDQFLAFAGNLFEEVTSAELLGRHAPLPPERQEAVLRESVQHRWDDIPRRMPNGGDVQSLLESIHQLARWDLNKGRASYGAGGAVTGVGMAMNDRARLIEQASVLDVSPYERLVKAIAACISDNLLEVSLDRSQGSRGQRWMVLYLNRWLCLHFGLPLQYGGWRHTTPEELDSWLRTGFRAPRARRRS